MIAVVIIAADRLAKWLAFAFLEGQEGIKLINHILSLQFVANKGVAFGLFPALGNIQLYLAPIVCAILGWLLWRYQFTKGQQIAMAMMIGGALGNAADRLLYGYVVDMIQLDFISFPVFNIADMGVTLGAVVLMISLLISKKPIVKKERE